MDASAKNQICRIWLTFRLFEVDDRSIVLEKINFVNIREGLNGKFSL